MSVSTRTRFEVFKRDGFTCQYCRRTPDEDGVKLHVDHVIPRKEGGGDEIENLVTACQDCNFGKAAKMLGDRAPVANIDDQLEAMRVKRSKLEEYEAEKRREKELRENDYRTVWNYWFQTWNVDSLENWHVPWENVLRGYIKSIGVEEIKDAMDITAAKFPTIKTDAVRYFNGVCKRKVADAEGRLVLCTECNGRIVLTREQVADTHIDENTTWVHTKCKEERDAKPAESLCEECGTEQIEPVYGMCAVCFERIRYELETDEAANSDEITLEVQAWDDLAEAAGF